MNEHRIQQIFQASVIIKGIHALVECFTGLALAFISTNTIVTFVNAFLQKELKENSHDLIAAYFFPFVHSFSLGKKNYYAFYLLVHGVIKIFLVIGLLKKILWV